MRFVHFVNGVAVEQTEGAVAGLQLEHVFVFGVSFKKLR
jgi:hypothetical protein